MAIEAVWGLDIGQCALKAVKGRASGNLIEVLAFDHIEYRQALSTAGTDSSATIREALQTFLSRNDVEDSAFAVSIAAGRSALIRFIKLPPVDRRKVPDIVRYEATQQIPFPLEDVIWDHQLIDRAYAPGEELEVGIFAMRRESIFDFLSNLMVSGIEVDNIQLSAVALYNCIHYDQPVEEGAIMGVDIGAENTNLVVVDGNNVWTRSLPIGGNDFTRAIATKYGLEFDQAEKLKRNLGRSKKAQEVFEALRPSLRSLLDEIQRSAGYYRSLHKGSQFVKLIGFGSGFRMYGVQRFLEAGLAYPVETFETTNNVIVDGAINQQFFKKSPSAFGAALGLTVQGLGLGGIDTTLMPPAIIKERILKRKRPALIAAAAILAGAFAWPALAAFTRPTEFPGVTDSPVARRIKSTQEDQKKFDELVNVKAMEREFRALVSVQASRAAQLDAFNVLMASVEQARAESEYPLFVQSLALDSGGQGWVGERLMSKSEVTSGATGTKMEAQAVKEEEFIQKTVKRVRETTRRSTTTRLSAEDRDAKLIAAMIERERVQQAGRERREQMINSGAMNRRPGAGQQPGVRSEAKVPFQGVGHMAQLIVETADPDGAVYVRGLCQMLRKTPGVLYCEYVYADKTPIWEDPETNVREYEEPRSESSTFQETEYTFALIQWVYKKGAVPVKKDDKAPAAAPAAAPPMGSPVKTGK